MTSFYQKYRPDKISELDLKSVRDELSKIIGTKQIAHAYLFVGPRGSGKTSAARIIARVVNCQKSEGGVYTEPCGECEACISIKKQSAVDVLEIDAASHRGIDDIRDLRDKIRLAPAVLRKKVYIIDEVHMLTNEAFNALLKTLEEPPSHAIFILCTTEDHKVPETISSRCVRVVFRKGTEDEVRDSLMRAVKGEAIKMAEEALSRLATSVDGSFREGHKILEQLSLTGKDINLSKVIETMGLMESKDVVDLISLVERGNVREVSKKLGEIETAGVDSLAILKELLLALQLRIRAAAEKGTIDNFDKEMISGLVSISAQVKTSPLPFLPIELFLTVIAMGRGGDEPEGQEQKQTSETKVCENKIDEKVEPKPIRVDREDEAPLEKVATSFPVSEIKIEKIVSDWPELLSRLSPRNHSVAGLLRSAKPKMIDGNRLTIEVFYKFHMEQLEQPTRREMIEDEATAMWGPLTVKCVMGEKGKETTEVSGGSVSTEVSVAEEVFS